MTYQASFVIAPYDEDIAGILQAMVAGCTGLPGNLVRPRYQSQPPTQPSVNDTWCDIYLNQKPASDFPQITVDDAGQVTLHRYEELDILLSFYGPRCGYYTTTFRDSVYAPNNVEELARHSLKLMEVGTITGVPDLINAQYIGRNDVQLKLVRFVDSILPVGTLINDVPAVTIATGVVTVEPPS